MSCQSAAAKPYPARYVRYGSAQVLQPSFDRQLPIILKYIAKLGAESTSTGGSK